MKSSNFYFLFIYLLSNILCGISVSFSPQGKEVVSGSVLLPTSRRGRYLANIVRRQAVDGTQVKFNKDADRMNAEAKKKIDVLSDELLPYIVGEQERRASLNKRVMSAIQSGERGVTLAEIRGRPVVAIKRGLYYRCPLNRPIQEPDISGTVICEDGIKPTQIFAESCLMSEDAQLYVVGGKDHFYCNRHKEFMGELPQNNTVVIACDPRQRTSYDHTLRVCSLENTGDVLVHYRYYPDRTYKFVSEIDPDHEICDRWNPCQIGYLFHLQNPENAIPAEDLHQNAAEEIIAGEDEDEFASLYTRRYSSPLYRVPACKGCTFRAVVLKARDGSGQARILEPSEVRYDGGRLGIHLAKVTQQSYGPYSVLWDKGPGAVVETKLLTLLPTKLAVQPLVVTRLPGEMLSGEDVQYHCDGCVFRRMLHMNDNGDLSDVPLTRVKNDLDKATKTASTQVVVNQLDPKDFGEYFMVVQNKDKVEEKIKVLELNLPVADLNQEINLQAVSAKVLPHTSFSLTAPYTCSSCRLLRVVCAGEDCTHSMSLTPHSVSFEGSSFDDARAGVHIAIFNVDEGREVWKRLFVVENAGVTVTSSIDIDSSLLEKNLETTITYKCDKQCSVDKLTMDSQLVPSSSYKVEHGKIHLKFEKVPELAVLQAKFLLGDVPVTKNVLNITESIKKSNTSSARSGATEKGVHLTSTIKSEVAVLHELKEAYTFKTGKPIDIILNLHYATADDPATFVMKSGGKTMLAIQILATRQAEDNSSSYVTPVRLHKDKAELSDAGKYEITVYGKEKKTFSIHIN